MELGLVREFISKVQQTRKDSGFEVTDHIEIYAYSTDKLNTVLTKYAKTICKDTLSDKLEIKLCDNVTDIDLNGEIVKTHLVRK